MIDTSKIDIYGWENGDEAWAIMELLQSRIGELESTIKTVIELGGHSFGMDEIKVFLAQQLPKSELTLEAAIEKEFGNRKSRFGLKAFKMGFLASQEGKSQYACPYADLRTDRGSVTFSRAYRSRWFAGYEAHQKSIGK